MNVRQNRAPTKGKTETPDTRIAVEDVRARLYTLVRARAEQGDKRAARLREWLESPESGRPGFTGRWNETGGQIDKAVKRAGMRWAGLSAQSRGPSGVGYEEGGYMGIRPEQVELLRQPVPAAIRRMAEPLGVDDMGVLFSKVTATFLESLSKELSRLDAAAQTVEKVREAPNKAKLDRDKARAKYEAASERYASTGYNHDSPEFQRSEAAYEALAKASTRLIEAEERNDKLGDTFEGAFRPAAWVEILTLARWILAFSAASLLWARLFEDLDLATDDAEARGLYPALVDALTGAQGPLYDSVLLYLMREGAPASIRRSQRRYPAHLPSWLEEPTGSLVLGDEADSVVLNPNGWVRGLFDSQDRTTLSRGRWKERVDRLRTLLERIDYQGTLSIVRLYGSGKQKNVPILIGRPLVPEHGEIAGFRVSIYGMRLFVSQSRPYIDLFYNRMQELIPVSLRIVREQAQRYFPALLREYKPSQTLFNLVPPYAPPGGHYFRKGNTVVAYPHSFVKSPPRRLAKLLVHEMGHHVWEEFLSPAKRQVWIDAVEQNAPYDLTILRDAMLAVRGPLKQSLRALVARELSPLAAPVAFKVGDGDVLRWLKDNNGYLYVLTQRLQHKYVYMKTLQDTKGGDWQAGDAVGGLSKDTTLEEVEAMIAAKEAAGEAPVVYFKGLPTTVYGATNVEEGWCEALSYYIIYGPDSVLPQLRAAMRRLLPDMRRNPDDEDDETPPEGRG